MSRRQFAVVLLFLAVIVGLQIYLLVQVRKVDVNAQDAEELAGQAVDNTQTLESDISAIQDKLQAY